MKTLHKNIIVIIDGYSTGRFLASAFSGYGYGCIHIESNPNLSDIYRANFNDTANLFIETIPYQDNIFAIIKKLSRYQVKCIIPGSEAGVTLADLLNGQLNLETSNGMEFSLPRRNKYVMQETLKAHNIAAIPQLLSKNSADIFSWIDNIGFPIVLKPVSSSDSEGVSFCNSREEILTAYHNLIAKCNLYGEKNDEVLVQKKMEGKEYVINSVSYNGQHFITDIWTNIKRKIQNNYVYDYQDLILPSDPIFPQIKHYINSVLDTLNIRYGAAHCEIIITNEGPVLIEMGARLAGGVNPSAIMDALGYSQLSVLVAAYLNPSQFFNMIKMHEQNQHREQDEHSKLREPFEQRKQSKQRVQSGLPEPGNNKQKYLRIVSLIVAFNEGKIINPFNAQVFYNIPGFHSLQHVFEIDTPLQQTVDMTTSPGNIYLIADHQATLDEAYQKIRSIENSIYQELIESEIAVLA